MKSPYPYFGGKSRVAKLVWERIGDTPNYVEPFFGSGAVLLARPHEPRCETINDKCCFVSNFWRAIAFGGHEEVAQYCDWPVNESDLHARHLWLVRQTEFQERMKTDPEYYDPKIAGWWVWGISQWIGSGWCTQKGSKERTQPVAVAQGINRQGIERKRPRQARSGAGTHRGQFEVSDRVPDVQKPKGIFRNGIARQIPDLRGESGAYGRGIHRCGLSGGLYEYFDALAERMRRVRVCCGDWKRVLGPSPTYHVGVTGIFLDPPYSDKAGRDSALYAVEDLQVAHEVREWCIANGDNEKLRIALCGYEGEHEMPASWTKLAWRANGGYANSFKETEDKEPNAAKERIWFSPHCLKPQQQTLL